MLLLNFILFGCYLARIHSQKATYEEVKENITFILLTKSLTEYKIYDFSNGSEIINGSDFCANKETIFFYPGFNEVFDKHELNRSYAIICPELLAQNESNVIVINYGYFVEEKEKLIPAILDPLGIENVFVKLGDVAYAYFRAFLNSSLIAAVVTDFIINCFNPSWNLLANLHFLGFSLGAHIAGMVGNNITTSTNIKIHLITAPDPAGPLFYNLTLEFFQTTSIKCLESSDANRVIVIHTDKDHYGTGKKVGHLDYWPNKDGSRLQPGCNNTHLLDTCSHYYSCKLLACSIRFDVYPARLCNTYEDWIDKNCNNNYISYMGNSVDFSSPFGNYYLNATASCLNWV